MRVPQEFRPLRNTEAARPTTEPETRPRAPDEPGSGLPSGSSSEERRNEPPSGNTTDEQEARDDFFDDEPTTDHPQSEDVEMDFVGTHEPRADIGVLEPDPDDKESTQLLAQMGCSTQEALGRSAGHHTTS